MRIALLFNPKSTCSEANAPDDTLEEYDSGATVDRIASALRSLSADVEPVVADSRLPWKIREGRFDFAFNIAEGPVNLSGRGRRNREAIPAAVCELLRLPYTGSDPLTLSLTLDKAMARRVVSPEVPVARAILLEGDPGEDGLSELEYPVIVKPNDEGSSKGIRGNPVADTPQGARVRCRVLRANYGCPVLIEEFLPGTEVTVAVAGNGPSARVLGMMEIGPGTAMDRFVYSLERKRNWRLAVVYYVPPRLDPGTLRQLEKHACTAYALLGCRDLARMDFRLDSAGRPHFIECNPLPGLDPESGDVPILTRNVLPYEKLVQGVLLDAAARTGIILR